MNATWIFQGMATERIVQDERMDENTGLFSEIVAKVLSFFQ